MTILRRFGFGLAVSSLLVLGACSHGPTPVVTTTPPADQPDTFYPRFAKSKASAARADLLTPKAPDASLLPTADLGIAELAGALNGTWVRRLTMNGLPIETDSYYYFQLDKSGAGDVLLIDRVNQGSDQEDRFPAKSGALTITFVSRKYQVVDQYTKVAPAAAQVAVKSLGAVPLDQAMSRLVAGKFFDNVPQVSEAFLNRAQEGRVPNPEEAIPTLTVGAWKASLAEAADSKGKGVTIQLGGEVRGHETPGPMREMEQATFYKRGDFYIADDWVVKVGAREALAFAWDRVIIGKRPKPETIARNQPAAAPKKPDEPGPIQAKITLIEEYQTPGNESELSGIFPHPTQDGVYYVAANKRPNFARGRLPMLPEKYRGKLLTVNRKGEVLKAVGLIDEDYGDLASDGAGNLFVAVQEPPMVLKFEPETGKILDRIPLAGPAGGLEYDRDRGVLYAQLFVEHPHLAVVDVKTHATIKTLWSDEGALGLKKVDGDLLCEWDWWYLENPDEPRDSAELRLLDPNSGRILARSKQEGGIHSCMAALDEKVAGFPGFLCLVTVDGQSGKTIIKKYSYEKSVQ